MKNNELLRTSGSVTVTLFAQDGETSGSMILPTNSVVRVDTFDPADRSVGIFRPTIILEVGILNGGVFRGAGVFVELLDPETDAFAFLPVSGLVAV